MVCGDCNAKHREWLGSNVTDHHGRSCLEFCVASDCVQLIDEPTHISDNRLDLVFTDVPAIVKTRVCGYIGTSDHCPIEMDISVNQHIPNATIEKTVWLKSRVNWDGLVEACRVLNISDSISDPNPMAKLNKMLMDILVIVVPRKVIKIRTNDQPWFDDTYRRVYHDKQTKFNIWRLNHSQANYNSFVESRRAANRVYHVAERNYNNSLKRKLEEITQPHLWWTKLKSSIFGSNTSAIPPLLKDDGKLATDPEEKAEMLH